MTIAWGQNAANSMTNVICPISPAYLTLRIGELGLGPGEPKSATKPTRHQPLIGIDVLEYAFLHIMYYLSWDADITYVVSFVVLQLVKIRLTSWRDLTRSLPIYRGTR